MKTQGMSVISLLLVSSLVIGCSFLIYDVYDCKKDNSKLLKKVGIPMQENVLAFFQKNKRYPNQKESAKLMNIAGCKNNRQIEYHDTKNEKGEIYKRWASYSCDYGSMTLGYGVSIFDLRVKHNHEPFRFGFSKRNTRCLARFTAGGKSRKFNCSQEACFLKNWSA